MARNLEDIFNECYDRIRYGESLESCLRSYPQYRAQLEPLLRTTFDIGRRASYIHPRPEFKHWAQVRIESAQRYPRQQVTAKAPAASIWWRHGWAVAFTIVLVLVLTTGSTMAASSQALPTEPLYPVKLATEQVRLAFAVSDANKAQVETDLAKIRQMELEAMASAGNTQEAEKAAERYDDQFEKALIAIYKSEGVVIQPPSDVIPAAPEASTTTSTSTTTTTATPPTPPSPPAPTTPSENVTPPATVIPPPPAVSSENVTAPPLVTPPPPAEPSENTTQPAPVPLPAPEPEPVIPPATTTEPAPPTTVEPPPPTTESSGKAAKTEELRKSLHDSRSKAAEALKAAQDKARQDKKNDWQKARDALKKSGSLQDTTTKSNDTTGSQGNKNTGSQGSKNTGGTGKKTVQSDNTTKSGGGSNKSTSNRGSGNR